MPGHMNDLHCFPFNHYWIKSVKTAKGVEKKLSKYGGKHAPRGPKEAADAGQVPTHAHCQLQHPNNPLELPSNYRGLHGPAHIPHLSFPQQPPASRD